MSKDHKKQLQQVWNIAYKPDREMDTYELGWTKQKLA